MALAAGAALFLLLLLATAAVSASASTVAVNSPPIGCVSELETMLLCLPYLAAAPNNMSAYPSLDCCKALSFSTFRETGGNGACLCYLVRNGTMLGFPLNVTRVVNLFGSCRAIVAPLTWICLEIEPLPALSMTPYLMLAAPPTPPSTSLVVLANNDTDDGNNELPPVPAKPVSEVWAAVQTLCFAVLLILCIRWCLAALGLPAGPGQHPD